jgi:CubicO group peptidase (beta-lactamase class C family)
MFKPSAVCAAIALLAAGPLVHAAPAFSQDVAARIDQVLSATYKADAPGATVIVVKDGKTILRKGYGLADVERKQPLAPETVMRLGSVTKQFTAAAIMMLVDEGRIKLDDDITVYLPDYPAQGKKVTIEHLLTHTSGIVSYTGKPGFKNSMQDDLTVSRMIDSFKSDPLEFEPGSRYRYNNSGYFLLGAIIEKVSGQTYDKFVEQRIFAPLGMKHTAYEGHERSKAAHALGYTAKQGGGFAPGAAISMTQPYAAGSLVSNVDDMARWDAAVSSGKLLKAASWQRAFTPYVLSGGASTNYGYGWEMGKLQGAAMISHGGSIPGFKTFTLRIPSEKLYVAVLSNADSGLMKPDEAAAKASAIAIGKPFPEYKEVMLSAAALDALSGTYQAGEGGKRIFRREGERMVMQGAGRAPVTLNAYSDTGFFIPGSLSTIEFARGAQDRPTQVTIRSFDGEQSGQRIGDVPPPRVAVNIDSARFDAVAGRYQLAPKLVVELSREGDRYFAQPTNQPKLEVFAMSDTAFFAKQVDVELVFEEGAGGALTLRQNGRELKGAKLP